MDFGGFRCFDYNWLKVTRDPDGITTITYNIANSKINNLLLNAQKHRLPFRKPSNQNYKGEIKHCNLINHDMEFICPNRETVR